MHILDNDGLSGMTLFNNAARHQGLTQKKAEEQPVSSDGKPSLDDPFNDPSYWGIMTNQPAQSMAPPQPAPVLQQQTPPQTIVAAHADPNNPLALPKDQATLNNMIQQGVMQTIGGLAQINQQKNQTLDTMRRKFLDTPGYQPWYPTFEHTFTKLVNQGHNLEQAKAMSLQTIQELNALGHKPPERAMNAAIPSQYSGNHANVHGGNFRSDENPDAVTHITDEQKLEAREDWINRRNVHADYVKSNGANGMSFQEMYPAAFNRGRSDLVIVKK